MRYNLQEHKLLGAFAALAFVSAGIVPAPSIAQSFVFSRNPVWLSGPTNSTEAVAFGDVDGDGDLDVIFANTSLQANTLFINNGGNLSSAPVWTSGLERQTTDVALGDIDGDGDLDLVCGNLGDANTLYENTGGNLALLPVWSSAPSNDTRGVVLGDIDGDGDLDLVCGNGETQANTVYENVGGMLTTSPVSFSGSSDTQDVALGDMDGDGDLDLVCVNLGQPNTVYENVAGTLSQSPAWSSGPANLTFGMALGDIDGDGDLDLVCGNSLQANTLYENAAGTLSVTPVWASFPQNDTNGMALGDVDGDGDLDLLCGNGQRAVTPEANTIYENVGGIFSSSPLWISGPANRSAGVALGDLDGDGALDIACANLDQRNTVYRNTRGVFTDSPQWTSNPIDETGGVALGDIDGDGLPDFVAGNLNAANAMHVNRGNRFSGDPVWTSQPIESTAAVVVGDVDGDGDLDLVCGNIDQPNTMYYNTGGAFSIVPDWSSGPSNCTYGIALGDVDGDGDLDLVCGNEGQPTWQSNTLYLNDQGMFSITPDWVSPIALPTLAVALGDMDGDGDLDLIAGNTVANNVVYENVGGTFGTRAWSSVPQNPTSGLALGDVNADGLVDLVCGNLAQSNTLYLNEGGIFGSIPAWSSGPSGFTTSVALADVDGDGDLDLICGNSTTEGNNTVYLNTGGVLSDTPVWFSQPKNLTRSIAVADVDRDGDVDIVGGNVTEANTLYHGSRNPVFVGDPAAPSNQLPNNSAFVRSVVAVLTGPNRIRVGFEAVDVESDPVWILPGFQHEGTPMWRPIDVVGWRGAVGPLTTSPEGTAQEFEWDISRMPFDDRNVILRLRVLESPRRVSVVQHVAAHMTPIGKVEAERPEVATSSSLIAFPTMTVGDSLTHDLVISNRGTLDLSVSEIQVSAADLSIDPAPPFVIPPGQTQTVTVLLHPVAEFSLDRELTIVTDDPISPATVIPVSTDVRGLEFNWVSSDIYPTRTLAEGQEVAVQIIMNDYVKADALDLYYREGGAADYTVVPLEKTGTDPVNDRYLQFIPGSMAGTRGVEFFVRARNGVVQADDPQPDNPTRFRVRIKNQIFAHPGERYRMISLPFDVPATPILDVLTDNLGTYNLDRWRFFLRGMNPSTYIELPDTAGAVFIQGRSSWLVTRDDETIDTEPMDELLTTPTDSSFVLSLGSGWSMIGNPFDFPVAWSSVSVNGGPAPDDPMIVGPIHWNPDIGDYETVPAIAPFEGYWVHNAYRALIDLRIPPLEDQGVATVAKRGDERGWRLRISAASAGLSNRDNFVGVSPEASTSWDPLDQPDVPMIPGPGLTLYFPHAEWGERSGFYSSDIRSIRQAVGDGPGALYLSSSELWGHVWAFDVAKTYSNEKGGDEVTLVFADFTRLPSDAEVVLVDRELDRAVDVLAETSYSFYLGNRELVADELKARFLFIVGTSEFIEGRGLLPDAPQITTLHQNHPNPFNPSTIISYELARAGRVSVRVYDVRGALVETLESRYREPGRYELGWRGENQNGEQVSSGVYFYRLVTDDGTFTRKMLLLK